MGLKTTNLKAWSVHKYVVAVLWMEGRLSTSEIAKQVQWTGGQVKGFYTREFQPPRDAMARDERQLILDTLKEARDWFGVFKDKRFDDRFRAKELPFERLKRRKPDDPDDQKPPTKKELRRMAQEAAARQRQEEKAAKLREQGHAPRGIDIDALAWLYANALGDKNEQVARGGLMSRDRRKEALIKLRTHLEGRAINPLQAQDYEAVKGAGGQKVALPEYRKFCIDMIGGVREMLEDEEFLALEAIIDRDEFVWLSTPSGHARTKAYEAIRRSADIVAVYYQLMTRDDFMIRWGYFPNVSTMASRALAREESSLAQDVIDQLTRATA